jgi:hypothetical protein
LAGPVSDSPTTDAQPDRVRPTDGQAGGPAFAHASEAELSRILDFYAVRWEYEPRVFPILWNTDGDVLESFAPDFYLPDIDLYLELTTLRQKLVRKKNRKLRRLRELYPDVRIKLFYARDFRALMLKYGRLALADELTGTSGQVTPDRPYAELLAGPFGVDPAVWPPSVTASASVRVEVDRRVPPVSPAHRRRRRRPSPARRPIEAEAS